MERMLSSDTESHRALQPSFFFLMFIYRKEVFTVAASFDIFIYGNTAETVLQTTSNTYPVTESFKIAMRLSQIMASITMANTE